MTSAAPLYAGTVYSQQYPKASVSGVHAEYDRGVFSGKTLGHLAITGNVDKYLLSSTDTHLVASGSFAVHLYFTSAGLLEKTAANTFSVKDGSTSLFASNEALFVNPFMAGPSVFKIETLWGKPAGAAAGTLASASPFPFIGSLILLQGITYTSGTPSTLAFSTSGPTKLFSSDSLGSANVYMVPAPAAMAGGLVLLGSAWFQRRRSTVPEADASS